MKTRDQFVQRFKTHLAGMALFGVASEVKDGPLQRASKVLEIPDRVEALLGQMYDFLAAEEPKEEPAKTEPARAPAKPDAAKPQLRKPA